MATTPSQADRNASELWQRSRNAVGLKIEFEIASWPVLLKKSCAGTLVMWGYSWSAPARRDGGFFPGTAYGPTASEANAPRFMLRRPATAYSSASAPCPTAPNVKP